MKNILVIEGTGFIGSQLRVFCHVSDAFNAIFKILKSDLSYGDIINIASCLPISIKDIVNKKNKIIGKVRPMYGRRELRPLVNISLLFDISKVKGLIEWEPRISIDNGLVYTINSKKKKRK